MYYGSNMSRPIFLAIFIILVTLYGCVTDEEFIALRQDVASHRNQFNLYQEETTKRLSSLEKEEENITKQIINLSIAAEAREDKTRTIIGKLDELEYKLNEIKNQMTTLKKGTGKPSVILQPVDMQYELIYKEAFETFQKGLYEDAIKKFSEFIANYSGTPLIPNAYYWIGESYMALKNHEKAILTFQELIDKYPKSEKTPRALISQADAFLALKDSKSSITILKKVIELFPKSEEATIAERKLKTLSAQ